MANIRVKDLDNKTSFASNDEILLDSPSGTGTMLRDAFIAAVASQIVAAPSTYKIATLDGADKLTSSQDPSQSVSYLGGHDMVANSPALADGSGTAGDTYYVTNPGTRNYGSGNITAQEGDALVYSGSVWQLVEGIANILDGISTASTARTTLEVNSIGEDAQANALKTTAPALYFDGSSSVVTVADDDKLSFSNGVDDLPASFSAWVKIGDATNFYVASKNDGSAVREYTFGCNSSNKLSLYLWTDNSNYAALQSSTALTAYEGQWVHLAVTYEGAGPTRGNAFASAQNGITLYVNGSPVDTTDISSGTYAGMSNTVRELWLGRSSSSYAAGSIRDVKIFNRTLTADEVAELARGNDLGFVDEWGGATATSGTLTVGKRYRLRDWITGDDFTNVGAASNADGVEFIATGTTPTTWSNSSVVESIGTLADFRAERYDTSTSKLYDLSDNAFVGTGTSISITGREVPVYETGEYTPTFSFSGSATGLAYGSQYGRYTRIGNICHVTGGINLTAKGSDSGNPRITLPFTAFVEDGSNSVQGGSITYASDWATLSSPLTPWIVSGSNYFLVYDWGATGVTAVNQTNVTDTTNIRWSITYRIQ